MVSQSKTPTQQPPRLGINVLQLERYKEAFDRYDEAWGPQDLTFWKQTPWAWRDVLRQGPANFSDGQFQTSGAKFSWSLAQYWVTTRVAISYC